MADTTPLVGDVWEYPPSGRRVTVAALQLPMVITRGNGKPYRMHISVFGDLWKLVERDGKAVV